MKELTKTYSPALDRILAIEIDYDAPKDYRVRVIDKSEPIYERAMNCPYSFSGFIDKKAA